MAVDLVGVKDLQRDSLNPRRIAATELAKLRNSIRQFGIVQPLVVRRSDHLVIGGHQRLEAAVQEGLTEVPVVWFEGSDKEVRTLNLALNRISGEWDEGKLAAVLADLAGVGSLAEALVSLDPTFTSLAGFDEKELLKVLAAGLASPTDSEDLAALAAQLLQPKSEAPVARPSDLYQLGPHRLLCGDARDADALRRLCEGVQPSVLFTDPPYGVSYSADFASGRHASGRTNGRRARTLGTIATDDLPPTEHADFIARVLINAVEVLDAGAAIYLCGGTSTTQAYDSAFTTAGVLKSSIIVWDKIDFSFGRRDYQSRFEFIYYGWPSAGKHRFFGGRSQSDIWSIPRDATVCYVHPTQKPTALAERAIRNSSEAGEVVLDLFGGSGSTLIAAQQAGRRALLLELDPHYVDVINARWEAFTGGQAELVRATNNA